MPQFRAFWLQGLVAGFILLLTSPLMAQNVTFLSGQNFPASQSNTSVYIAVEGDLNGDGKPDLITVTSGTSDTTSISILLGNGDGTFQPPATIITGGIYYATLAVGDFNGDGHLDFAALWTTYLNKFSVFLGNGDGTFQNPITTTLQNPPTLEGGLAAADFNGDGKADLVLSGTAPQQGSSAVLVLTSNGDGTFQSPTSYVVPGAQVIVRVGDFNGDGKPDIVTSDLSVLLGNGNGTFQTPTKNSLSCGNPSYIVVGDFNNDGKDDLAISGALALSNGDGTFTAVCNTPDAPNLAADFNNDGLLDLVSLPSNSSGVAASVYLGKGDGTFQPPSTFRSSLSTGLSAADFDGDGKIDLAGPGGGNNVTVVHGNGDGTFRGYTLVGIGGFYQVPSWTTADLRRNGITDLLVFAYGSEGAGAVEIFLGNGNGTFQPTQVAAPGYEQGGAVGDFNNDGKLDLATGGDGLGVMLGNGDGTFGALTTYTGGGGIPQLGDFNGDGNEDIVVGSDLFLGNGDGTFGFPVTINVGGIVADVNGDGKPDFVASGGNAIDVYLNMGNLNFQLVQTPLNETAIPLGLADLNHDGRLDLVAAGGNGLLTLLGNGDGTFQLKGTFSAAAAGSVAFGDFNGDGNLDVATGGGSTVSMLLGNGDGTLQAAVNYDSGPVYNNTYGVFAADFNGDGKIDLATMNQGGIALLFNGVGVRTLGLGIPLGGSNSATVTAGSTATYTLAIGGQGISGTATLTCTGAPAGARCTLPGSENVSATTASMFTVSVSTAGRSASLQKSSSFPWLWAMALVGMVWLPVGRRSRGCARKGAAISSLLLVMFLASCGGGSGGGGGGGSGGTPAGTYTLTVKATMGSTTQSQTLKLIVQ